MRLERRAADSPLPVRHATEADQDNLVRLLFDAYSDSPESEEETLEGCREELASFLTGTYGEPRLSCSYVAVEPDGSLAAACLILGSHENAVIAYLCTHPKRRRQGIGRAVLTHSLNNLRLENFERCQASVAIDNTAAQNLLRNTGFRDASDAAREE